MGVNGGGPVGDRRKWLEPARVVPLDSGAQSCRLAQGLFRTCDESTNAEEVGVSGLRDSSDTGVPRPQAKASP